VIEVRRAAAGRDANDLSRVSDASGLPVLLDWVRVGLLGLCRPLAPGAPLWSAVGECRPYALGSAVVRERHLRLSVGWRHRELRRRSAGRSDATIVSRTSAGPLRSVRDRPTQVGRRDRSATPAVNEIVHRTRRISADSALRLARNFGTTERFWMNLQGHYDLEIVRDRLAGALDQIRPLASA
jgi:hypothetical protein